MDVLVITAAQIRRLICAGLFFLALVVCLSQLPDWHRAWRGAPAGVTLEGRLVGGLLPHELRGVISRLAAEIVRPPQNADYFQETGELIPEVDGITADTEGTFRRVMAAKPGERLKLLTRKVAAARDRSYYLPIYEGNPDRGEVSLTFNVAWGEEEMPGLLKILREERVLATFYFVGTWAEKFPELVRDIAGDGHEIANHGLYHGHPNQMSRADLERLITENQRLLRETIGREPARLFAPPYGEFNREVLNVAGDLGFRTILWTVDTVDWKRPAPELIRDRVFRKIRPGAIVLMHPTAPTVAALRSIIRDLRQKGLQPVPVSRLLQPGENRNGKVRVR